MYEAVAAVLFSHCCFFFFQAEDGIRDATVTGVQTCALPISSGIGRWPIHHGSRGLLGGWVVLGLVGNPFPNPPRTLEADILAVGHGLAVVIQEIGRASCRERVESSVSRIGRAEDGVKDS